MLSLRTYGWPVVDGIVRTAEMKSRSSGEGGTTYSPKISYEYNAGESEFTGETIAFGMMSGSSSFDDSRQYPVGKKVLVHYNPSNPAQAVLEPGIHGGTWSFLGLGTAFILVCGLVLKFSKPTSTVV
ncbi:MAG: hypothetical protein JWO95_1485 [Verrucomicrobiales bacterium]|nr:hypothetical protein [Verrucomicrobiales bacterium]